MTEIVPELLGQTDIGMARLRNWARWCVGGSIGMIMKHYYPGAAAVCGDYQRRGNDECEEISIIPINEIDAGKVEDELMKMPTQLCHAVRYFYTGRVPVNCVIRFDRMPYDQLLSMIEQAARRL
jgi:hypothetical protein